MRPASPTPGCFSMFRRKASAKECKCQKAAPPSATVRTAPDVDLTPVGPPPARPKYEHYDVCGCAAIPPFDLKIADLELPPYLPGEAFSSEVRDTIRATIDSYAEKLTTLSLWISDHPEQGFEEYQCSDKLAAFLTEEGFPVERSYKLLTTAFRASYTHGEGGRTFAFNSEYDALPTVGHACGHNLIAVAGVAALLGMRAAMQKHNIAGTTVLIGTPAEEGGVGKGILLERGGYTGVDGCMMIHPVGLPNGEGGIAAVTPTLAIQTINVAFHGRTAHAGGAPWDGVNALDAANIAYSSVSAMRQQMHPTDRVHGIITQGGEAPNIIPDYTAMRFYVRAQSAKGVKELMVKVKNIFDAAGKATGCTVQYTMGRVMYDLKNNLQMSEEFASAMADVSLPTHIALKDFSQAGGSTDFGNVTYALPACHPHYAIPCIPGRSNHTPEFMEKCRSPEAHDYTFKFAAGMSCVGARFIADEKFAQEAKKWWKEDMKDA